MLDWLKKSETVKIEKQADIHANAVCLASQLILSDDLNKARYHAQDMVNWVRCLQRTKGKFDVNHPFYGYLTLELNDKNQLTIEKKEFIFV